VITLVSVDRVDAVWPHVREALEAACRRTGGDLTSATLWAGCRRSENYLLIAHDETVIKGVSVWRPENWATGRKLRCLAVAGVGMKDWLRPMREEAANLAKLLGATAFVADGRTGWKRTFPKARVVRVVLEEAI
jgi:hypothetical protein